MYYVIPNNYTKIFTDLAVYFSTRNIFKGNFISYVYFKDCSENIKNPKTEHMTVNFSFMLSKK